MQLVDLCSVGLGKLKKLSMNLLMRISYSSRFCLKITWAQLYLTVHSGKFILFEFTSLLMKR